MATGRSNQLTGQIGEYLVCAELGRLGLIATSFTGNVPEYDLLVCDAGLKSLPIQVKTSRSTGWPSRASLWLDIELDDAAKQQINHGRNETQNGVMSEWHELKEFHVFTGIGCFSCRGALSLCR
jgi:hypothetical protein